MRRVPSYLLEHRAHYQTVYERLRIIQVQIDMNKDVGVHRLLVVIELVALQELIIIILLYHVDHNREDDGPHGQPDQHEGVEEDRQGVLLEDVFVQDFKEGEMELNQGRVVVADYLDGRFVLSVFRG